MREADKKMKDRKMERRRGEVIRLAMGLAAAAILMARASLDCQAGALEEMLVLDQGNGSIVALRSSAERPPIWRSGESGLWEARFRDGSKIGAAEFSTATPERLCRCEPLSEGGRRMVYESPEIRVAIDVRPLQGGVEMTAEVTPRKGDLLEFALPARLRFDPHKTVRLVCPANGNMSVGTAFRGEFFQQRPADRPAAWAAKSVGGKGYATLFGAPAAMRADHDTPVPLRVTEEGRAWLGSSAALIERCQGVVNRPSGAGQADVVLVDSPHGPYFSAKRLGEQGLLWRIGGAVREEDERVATEMVAAAVSRLAASPPSGRTKLAMISLANGPIRGSWAWVAVDDWWKRLARQPAVKSGRVELVRLETVGQLQAALDARDALAILNPYGEWLPVAREGGLPEMVERIGSYVRAGGNWFEVGGYSFYAELRPSRFYYEYGVPYPPAFADFLHLETQDGTAAVYRAQPRTWKPWSAAADPAASFIPGRLACGGDEQGGWCERPFGTFVSAGQTWKAPAVRLTVGGSAAAELRAYAAANGLTRRLADKVRPELLEKLKAAVLVYYGGACREKLAHLDLLPQPTLIHFADYLHGGFDKQYPDHLPPNAAFGSAQEFRALFDKARAMGHLVMPYTNPTWWCDDPRGPTFQQHGEAPLLKTLDGKLSAERYADNTGFTICHWHPAVQEANRRTVRQFLEEYPVDVLFQDQCGARSWRYDTNPASPAPHAYLEGLLSMVDEDSRRVPLSTESGWDRVAEYEAQLCGMSWQLVPTQHAPSWRRLMKEEYDPATWEVFPVAQYLAHDKAVMLHHDLGQFVTNQEVLAWTLGLGFAMSYRAQAPALADDGPREWLRWLDRIQKSVCARYVGAALDEFQHDRPANASGADDGTVQARYGDLRIAVNLGPVVRRIGDVELAPFGFHAAAPGMVAGHLGPPDTAGEAAASFVTETVAGKTEVWVYASPEQEVAILLPQARQGRVPIVFEPEDDVTGEADDSVLRFRLPKWGKDGRVEPRPLNPTRYLWHGSLGD